MTVDPGLADKFALQELCAKYSRAVDRRDFALLRSLYHDDANDEHGSMFAGGATDFVDYVSRTVSQFESTSHYITNMIFAVDGNKAEGEIYKINYHRTSKVSRGRGLAKFSRGIPPPCIAESRRGPCRRANGGGCLFVQS